MPVKQLIERVELTSSASSITFSSIPQTFAHLMLVHSIRTNKSAVEDELVLDFNGSGTNFNVIRLDGNGSTADYAAYTVGRFAHASTASTTSNTFGNGYLYISNYTASQNKSFSSDSVSENNATEAYQSNYAGLWSNTSAITSLSFDALSGDNLLTGSVASLYGITRGGSGTVTTA